MVNNLCKTYQSKKYQLRSSFIVYDLTDNITTLDEIIPVGVNFRVGAHDIGVRTILCQKKSNQKFHYLKRNPYFIQYKGLTHKARSVEEEYIYERKFCIKWK